MKTKIILLLVFILSISSATYASYYTTNEELLEKNIQIFDASDMELKEVNLTPDYERDYSSLIEQIKEQNIEYNNTLKELFNESSVKDKKKLEKEIARFEKDFDKLAITLLEDRYLDNKKELRPEIIEQYKKAKEKVEKQKKYKSSFEEQDSLVSMSSIANRTWTLGNWGTTDESGAIANAWYSHYNNNNYAYLYVNTGEYYATAVSSNGVQYTTASGIADISFRYVEKNARLTCYEYQPNDWGAVTFPYSLYEVKASIYDVTANSYREFTSLRNQCDPKVGELNINEGPSRIDINDYAFVGGRTYRTFLRTYGDVFAGSVDAGDGLGTKWSYIELKYK